MLHKLATVGLLDASLDSCDEAGLILEHPCNRVLHQLLSVFTIGNRDLLESRFDVGREMYFHVLQGTRKSPPKQLGTQYRRASVVG